MKLYNLKRGDKYRIVGETQVPPEALEDTNQVYTLGNIDGMYSNSVGEDGQVYYFAAWTEVEAV